MNDHPPAVAAPARSLSPDVLVPLALFGVYVIWGSTYYGLRVALGGFPPFALAAIRFVIAGGLLYALLRWRGGAAPTWRQWLNCLVTGTLLLGIGNGGVCYAEQTVASGITAVAVASAALFMAIFAGWYGQWPNRMEWVGLVIGFAGIVVLNLGGELRGSPAGAIALVLSPVAWAFGSVWSKHQDMPEPMMSAAAQMLAGSVPLAIVSVASGEHFTGMPDATSMAAMAYLIVFGSLLGFSAYIYLLHHTRPALASSYAYVNPPVAVLVGVLLGGEVVSRLDIVGTIVIVAGVAAITLAKTKK
ncbi:drug/metabolite exporter YedA [Rudaea cellulosilytica]|uniref:drug/metabolite exporter YedA n=1 Tax=Rudaea cellulosilytica TaxID=540746 RepID=UPI00035C3A09|nr:drug/metabolite exporter YedA [Rudaea cellulosilytica]